jgi:hypothetical protein
MQFYRFSEVKECLGHAIEEMMINVKKLKRVADIVMSLWLFPGLTMS